MAYTKRRKPYIWVTWLAAALAGDNPCAFIYWLKTNYQYDKLPEDPERAKALAKWKADHAEMVQAEAELLRSNGYEVSLESENKFTVRGKAADVAGAADIAAFNTIETLVVDEKTGRRKSEHMWQVMIYLLMLPRVDTRFMNKTKPTKGIVRYSDGKLVVDAIEADAESSRVYARIAELASPNEPKKTPGAHCRFCDIADCEARMSPDATAGEVDTEDF